MDKCGTMYVVCYCLTWCLIIVGAVVLAVVFGEEVKKVIKDDRVKNMCFDKELVRELQMQEIPLQDLDEGETYEDLQICLTYYGSPNEVYITDKPLKVKKDKDGKKILPKKIHMPQYHFKQISKCPLAKKECIDEFFKKDPKVVWEEEFKDRLLTRRVPKFERFVEAEDGREAYTYYEYLDEENLEKYFNDYAYFQWGYYTYDEYVEYYYGDDGELLEEFTYDYSYYYDEGEAELLASYSYGYDETDEFDFDYFYEYYDDYGYGYYGDSSYYSYSYTSTTDSSSSSSSSSTSSSTYGYY